MVQFLSIIFFSWISSIFVGFIKSSLFFCVTPYKRNVEERLGTHSYCRDATSISYSVCVSVGSVIKHEKRMRRIILSSMVCLHLSYFSHIIS